MRIAIANDMAMAVEAMRRIIARSPAHELAWTARDGEETVRLCAQDTPDLILMDLMMPVLDGVEATRRIMAKTPCAILVVTASVGSRSAKVFEALGAGALDAVSTPTLGSDDGAALLTKIDTIRRLITTEPQRNGFSPPPVFTNPPGSLIAIGASAGGPAALAEILGALPRNFATPIVIVQHVDAEFAPSMASWLNEQSKVPVRLARQEDHLQSGCALIAGTDQHLVFTNSRTLGYTPHPREVSCSPSVDIFFESVARHWRGKIVGVLLTGMGRDGAKGLRTLRNAGALTIAQDRASCVVYGMPKAAADLNAAAEILPLSKIAPRLCTTFSS